MKLCLDRCLGLILELKDGADIFPMVQFLYLFGSFSPCEMREVGDLCCHRVSQIGTRVPLSYTNQFEVVLSWHRE